jgi:ribulose-phosphate 3-epimerase
MAETAVSRVRQLAPALSVGALSANLLCLEDDVARIAACGVGLLHFDVMDGHAAPALTVGPPFIRAIKTTMLKDVHLIIDEPCASIPDYVAAGADIITIHIESCRHPRAALELIGRSINVNESQRGIMRGVAINPGTPVAALKPLLDLVDLAILVAVNPGFSGQKFAPNTAERFAELKELVAESGRAILVGIDGGVAHDNIDAIACLQPDYVVSGSALFSGGDLPAAVLKFNQALVANRHTGESRCPTP